VTYGLTHRSPSAQGRSGGGGISPPERPAALRHAGWQPVPGIRPAASAGSRKGTQRRLGGFGAAVAAAMLALAAHLPPAAAATYRVDDSATIPFESSATMRWRHAAPVRSGDNTVEADTQVQVRLNLAPWLKRNGRVYLVLPAQTAGALTVQWSTQGRLLPGKLAAGQRVLVYAGPISEPMLAETLALKFEADGTRLSGSHRLDFHFEIDVD
jgi:hypothetical protein